MQIARRADADLFISLHADSGPRRQHARRFGLHRVRQGLRARWPRPRQGRLADEGQSAGPRIAPSARSCWTCRSAPPRTVRPPSPSCCWPASAEETTLLRRSHRDAGFIVLLAPDVPAVLLEMGFITNPEDEAFLTTKASRNRPGRRGRRLDRGLFLGGSAQVLTRARSLKLKAGFGGHRATDSERARGSRFPFCLSPSNHRGRSFVLRPARWRPQNRLRFGAKRSSEVLCGRRGGLPRRRSRGSETHRTMDGHRGRGGAFGHRGRGFRDRDLRRLAVP